MERVIEEIRVELKSRGTEEIRLATRRFFKEDIRTHGLNAPEVARIAREAFRKIKDRPKSTVLELCEELWRSGYLEEAGIACEWSFAIRRQFSPDDFAWVMSRKDRMPRTSLRYAIEKMPPDLKARAMERC